MHQYLEHIHGPITVAPDCHEDKLMQECSFTHFASYVMGHIWMYIYIYASLYIYDIYMGGIYDDIDDADRLMAYMDMGAEPIIWVSIWDLERGYGI